MFCHRRSVTSHLWHPLREVRPFPSSAGKVWGTGSVYIESRNTQNECCKFSFSSFLWSISRKFDISCAHDPPFHLAPHISLLDSWCETPAFRAVALVMNLLTCDCILNNTVVWPFRVQDSAGSAHLWLAHSAVILVPRAELVVLSAASYVTSLPFLRCQGYLVALHRCSSQRGRREESAVRIPVPPVAISPRLRHVFAFNMRAHRDNNLVPLTQHRRAPFIVQVCMAQ